MRCMSQGRTKQLCMMQPRKSPRNKPGWVLLTQVDMGLGQKQVKFVRQVYRGGEPCDIVEGSRETEVRFVCAEDRKDSISSVKVRSLGASLKSTGYIASYLTGSIGHLDPTWQPYV
jgi:hypothetical protein